MRLAAALLAASAFANERVDALFAEFDKPDSPGCSVAVVRSREVIYTRGYGMADLERSVKNTPRSVFYLASVSKQLTALAVLLAEQDGKITLDDPVRRYVPELPKYASEITIRHLLHHTSGLRDYLSLGALAGRPDNYYTSDDEMLALLSRQKALNFEPGTEYLYSNSGYVLLSIIVRRATGATLREWSAKRIFEPLGMKHSLFYDDHTEVLNNRAIGYSWTQGRWYTDSATLDVVGDGGAFSTVEDLVRWDINFTTMQVGGNAGIELLQRPGRLASGKELTYAMGLAIGDYRGLRTVSHAGALRGYSTDLLRFPDEGFTFVCLCNQSRVGAQVFNRQVADVYLGVRMKKPDSKPPAAPKQAPQAVGTGDAASFAGAFYSEELDSTWTIDVEKGILRVYRHWAEPRRLTAAGRDEFTATQGLHLHFERNPDGLVTGFTLDAGRVRGLRFERKAR